jgi:hypothetical protein
VNDLDGVAIGDGNNLAGEVFGVEGGSGDGGQEEGVVEGSVRPRRGGLHRQLADFENAGQNGVASDETQLIQPRKADVECQHEPVQVHGTGNPLRRHRLFHQGLEAG